MHRKRSLFRRKPVRVAAFCVIHTQNEGISRSEIDFLRVQTLTQAKAKNLVIAHKNVYFLRRKWQCHHTFARFSRSHSSSAPSWAIWHLFNWRCYSIWSQTRVCSLGSQLSYRDNNGVVKKWAGKHFEYGWSLYVAEAPENMHAHARRNSRDADTALVNVCDTSPVYVLQTLRHCYTHTHTQERHRREKRGKSHKMQSKLRALAEAKMLTHINV